MPSNALVRESTGPLFEPTDLPVFEPASPPSRGRASAFLAAIEPLANAASFDVLIDRAAQELRPLLDASGAVVYVALPDSEPLVAAAGTIARAAAAARLATLNRPTTHLVGAYSTLNQGKALASSFEVGDFCATVLVEREGRSFMSDDGLTLAIFARYLAMAALAQQPSGRRRGPARGTPSRRLAQPDLLGSNLIGRSPALARVREVCRVAARSTSSLLIEGESGVGKEVLAQAVHAGGLRAQAPFIAVHCAAIPRDLLESELFGYERGAFTGADPHGRPGKFELADGGTLLLDDVVELPLEMQAKLLRTLQEKSVTRLAAKRPRTIDVRIIATTNVPLRQAVADGRFRADLFYRLNVLHLPVPPLRERREDIRMLAEHFLHRYSPLLGRRLETLGEEALASLEAHTWPGNVRELEHWIESEIHFAPPEATCLQRLRHEPGNVPEVRAAAAVRPMADVEREVYAEALALCGGDVTRAAKELGVSRGKLYRKLRLYDIPAR